MVGGSTGRVGSTAWTGRVGKPRWTGFLGLVGGSNVRLLACVTWKEQSLLYL